MEKKRGSQVAQAARMFKRTPLLSSALFLSLFAASVIACGGSTASTGGTGPATNPDPNAGTDTSGGDTTMTPATPATPPVDNGAPSTTYPAPHPAAPQLENFGGAVMTAPHLIPIFFPNDADEAQLLAFTKSFPQSKFFAANTAEYGVGAGDAADAIDIATAPAANLSDSDVQTWLSQQITAKAPGFEKVDANTLFIIYYPASTIIDLQGEQSCQTFGGYHDSVNVGGQDVSYAVVPRCSDFAGPGESTLDVTTGSASHEIMEAATDPVPQSQSPGYAQPDAAHAFWAFLLGGGEDGDMCAQFPDSFTKDSATGFVEQRSWSNKAAAAGHDPCVPAPANQVYFNSAVNLPDTLDLGGGYKTKAISMAVGESKTVEVDLFSDAKTSGAWTVGAMDESAFGGGSSNLDFSWDRKTGVNGEKLHLTVTLKSKPQQGASGFFIVSKLNGQEHYWLGLVGEKTGK
jgi:hypothetical protein